MNFQQMTNVQADALWIKVQGKKIMAVGGISFMENQTVIKNILPTNIDKENAPAFPLCIVKRYFFF